MSPSLPPVLLAVALTFGHCNPGTGSGGTGTTTPPEIVDEEEADAFPDWTIGVVDVHREEEIAQVLDVRVGEHADFDRMVFEFEASVPGYRVSYIDAPAIACGTGHQVWIPGDAWLEVELYPARGHTEEGVPTVPFHTVEADLPVLLEVERLCDYEAMVTWVAGAAVPNPFRVFELSDPPRLVVDIQH